MPSTCVRPFPGASTISDEQGVNPRWMTELLTRLRTASDGHGHILRTSRAAGVPYQSAKTQLGNAPRQRVDVVVLLKAILDIRQDNPEEAGAIAQLLAEQLDGTFTWKADVPIDDETPEEVLVRAAAELGDVARAVRAGADGWTEEEKRRFDQEAVEAIDALQTARVVVMHA